MAAIDLELVKKLVRAGYSYSQIGAMLGTTKNVVLGKVWRAERGGVQREERKLRYLSPSARPDGSPMPGSSGWWKARGF